MKKHRVKIIVFVMTLSVIGLIAVQIFWLRNVIKVEEERFERKVNDALLSVAQKIDKEEVAERIIKKIESSSIDQNKKLNSAKGQKRIINDSTTHIAFIVKDSLIKPTANFQFRYLTRDNDSAKVTIVKFDSASHKTILINNNFSWQRKIDSIVVRKKQLVEDVVTDIIRINTEKKIEERLSVDKLNKYISEELKSQGIDTEFNFGIYKSYKDTLVLTKKGTDTDQLMKSRTRTFLFPDEVLNSPNQLIIYFPNKDTYLLSTVSGMLILSMVLIIVISALFYKTLQMFINQKKITEIKNDLINNITHEFKTPISTISVACEALNEPQLIKESSSINRYTSIIKEENERLRMMVETLLNTAAIEKGTLHLNKEQIDINELVKISINKFDETIKKKNGKVEIDFCEVPLICEGDKFHLTNCLSNLIDNAIKYNENEPIIKIKTTSENNLVKISISDNGMGIAKDQLDKIFNTFYRVQSGNIQNVRGNGIGLSYCKKIIEAHNGRISVSSNPGQGSTFEIYLQSV